VLLAAILYAAAEADRGIDDGLTQFVDVNFILPCQNAKLLERDYFFT
jgi:hypothetical protein